MPEDSNNLQPASQNSDFYNLERDAFAWNQQISTALDVIKNKTPSSFSNFLQQNILPSQLPSQIIEELQLSNLPKKQGELLKRYISKNKEQLNEENLEKLAVNLASADDINALTKFTQATANDSQLFYEAILRNEKFITFCSGLNADLLFNLLNTSTKDTYNSKIIETLLTANKTDIAKAIEATPRKLIPIATKATKASQCTDLLKQIKDNNKKLTDLECSEDFAKEMLTNKYFDITKQKNLDIYDSIMFAKLTTKTTQLSNLASNLAEADFDFIGLQDEQSSVQDIVKKNLAEDTLDLAKEIINNEIFNTAIAEKILSKPNLVKHLPAQELSKLVQHASTPKHLKNILNAKHINSTIVGELITQANGGPKGTIKAWLKNKYKEYSSEVTKKLKQPRKFFVNVAKFMLTPFSGPSSNLQSIAKDIIDLDKKQKLSNGQHNPAFDLLKAVDNERIVELLECNLPPDKVAYLNSKGAGTKFISRTADTSYRDTTMKQERATSPMPNPSGRVSGLEDRLTKLFPEESHQVKLEANTAWTKEQQKILTIWATKHNVEYKDNTLYFTKQNEDQKVNIFVDALKHMVSLKREGENKTIILYAGGFDDQVVQKILGTLEKTIIPGLKLEFTDVNDQKLQEKLNSINQKNTEYLTQEKEKTLTEGKSEKLATKEDSLKFTGSTSSLSPDKQHRGIEPPPQQPSGKSNTP